MHFRLGDQNTAHNQGVEIGIGLEAFVLWRVDAEQMAIELAHTGESGTRADSHDIEFCHAVNPA